ncbi:MAG: TRAP transporter TatT component family protein [Rubrivivax sp.]|nr:TRAP transporter TatT component family protein [Rubrivivax sp.]
MSAALLTLTACAPRTLLLKGVADELAGQGQADEEDLGLARDAAAFYLKLSESVLRQTPGHPALAEAVAGGFTQYAYAFVAFEAEKLEATDVRAAARQRQRAARLYQRAQGHAMAALELQQPGLARALATPAPTGTAPLRLAPQQVGLAYWAAASWGAFIALSKDQPEVVADLPLAVRLAQLAFDAAPEHGQGSLAVLMAQFELARPGGTAARAESYLARADAASGTPAPVTLVARAESIALPVGDRAGFERLLRQAIAAAAPRRDLSSQVLRERAQWLLDTIDDRF